MIKAKRIKLPKDAGCIKTCQPPLPREKEVGGGEVWGSLLQGGDRPGGRGATPGGRGFWPPVPLRKLRPRWRARGGRGLRGRERSPGASTCRGRGEACPSAAAGLRAAPRVERESARSERCRTRRRRRPGSRAACGACRAVGGRGPPVRPRSRLPRRPARAIGFIKICMQKSAKNHTYFAW